MILKVKRSENLNGDVRMPRSKTHSFRALILASLTAGESVIRNPKISNDWNEAVKAMRMYGAKINETEKNTFSVKGVGGDLKTPGDIINVKNSGTMLVFIAGVAAACKGWTVLTGDESLRTLRKITRNFIRPFEELNIKVISTKDDGMAPFIIKGRVNGGIAHMDGTGCQPVFSVLIASALSSKPIDLYVSNPGETAYIDLLLYWFKRVGLKFENIGNNYTHYHFPGNNPPEKFDAEIPFEWSAPAYPLLAAVLCPDSNIRVRGMDNSDPYGDRFVLDVLCDMGAHIDNNNGVISAKTSRLHAVEVDMNKMPDQVPTVAVAACFARGKTVIKNAETARWKECDRISACTSELTKMGAKISERKDGLVIYQDGSWKLKGCVLDGYKDHRMVMSLALAGMNSDGESLISGAEMVEKSFDTFIPDMQKAGAKMALL